MAILGFGKRKEEKLAPIPSVAAPLTAPVPAQPMMQEPATLESVKSKMDLLLSRVDNMKTQQDLLNERISNMERILKELYAMAKS